MTRLLAGHRRWVAAGLALGAGCALAAFSSQTSNGPNSFSAAPDQRVPEVARSVIVKSQGGEVGFIRPTGGYFIYGQVDDVGNPPSGTASVRDDLLNVSLAPGGFTAGGASYNWRSAQQPASNAAAGTYAYGLIVDDNAGNAATRTGYSVVVDGTAPATTDVQATNKAGGTAGRPEIGDSITFSTSEPIDPQSVLANWSGVATNVVVRLNNVGTADTLTVANAGNTALLPLGTVALKGDSVTANATFGASGTPSSMVRSGNAITITLGTQSGTTATLGNLQLTWTPVTGPYDRAGNSLPTTARNETGTSDRDF